MSPEVRVIIKYALTILAGALSAGLGVMATQLAGTDDINWRPVLAAAIGPVVAGLMAMRLPQPENAPITAQVDHLRASAIPRDEMLVVSAPRSEAAAATAHAERALAGETTTPRSHEWPGEPPHWQPTGRRGEHNP